MNSRKCTKLKESQPLFKHSWKTLPQHPGWLHKEIYEGGEVILNYTELSSIWVWPPHYFGEFDWYQQAFYDDGISIDWKVFNKKRKEKENKYRAQTKNK